MCCQILLKRIKIGGSVALKLLQFSSNAKEKYVYNVLYAQKPKRGTLMRIGLYAYDRIMGRFAPEELQKVIKEPDSLSKIERVLHKRGVGSQAQDFVKWRGFPDKFNSYVREQDIVNPV